MVATQSMIRCLQIQCLSHSFRFSSQHNQSLSSSSAHYCRLLLVQVLLWGWVFIKHTPESLGIFCTYPYKLHFIHVSDVDQQYSRGWTVSRRESISSWKRHSSSAAIFRCLWNDCPVRCLWLWILQLEDAKIGRIPPYGGFLDFLSCVYFAWAVKKGLRLVGQCLYDNLWSVNSAASKSMLSTRISCWGCF